MAARIIVNGENVKQKWFYVVVERLVVQEQFDKKTQILTINFSRIAIHLENFIKEKANHFIKF